MTQYHRVAKGYEDLSGRQFPPFTEMDILDAGGLWADGFGTKDIAMHFIVPEHYVYLQLEEIKDAARGIW